MTQGKFIYIAPFEHKVIQRALQRHRNMVKLHSKDNRQVESYRFKKEVVKFNLTSVNLGYSTNQFLLSYSSDYGDQW